MDGTGLFEIGSGASTTYFPDGASYSGLLSIGGHGKFLSRKSIMFGHNGGTGEILVEEDGTFQCTDWFPIGEADNCTLAITVKDRGQFLASNAGIVQGNGRKLRMTVEDSATAEIRCGDMANNATAEFALGLKDNATLKIGDNGGNINFGNNSGGKIDFTMTGGSLESYSGGEANVIGFRGGPASTYTIAGGTITTKSMVIEGVQNDDVVARTGYTNTVRMTGGTVDTLTLGDGHGFAVLKLDAGDTVIVEAANGITANCGAIDVPWKSTEGTHAVFTCKQGVVVGELDKIAVHDGDATKDYAWTTEFDAGTGYTICSVTVAPKGTLTKTITYSSGTVTTNGTGVEITKTGSGKLVLGGGTFLYSGSDPLVFNGALRIAAPSTSVRW